MGEPPRTQYARNGDVHLAFQTTGEGDLDLLLVDTWVHHVEAVWDFPDFARFLRRLSSFGRLIHFDGVARDCPIRFRSISSRTCGRRSATPSPC
jgi:hypothetical protein